MNTSIKGAKDKIFQAVSELMETETSISGITSRQIAEKAQVNLALINYYFQSKENLFNQVAESKMAEIISQVLEYSRSDEAASLKLKKLLTATADFSFKHNEIFRVAIRGELKEGCKNSCALVMPLLSEIFSNKDEAQLKVIALQLMLPFHYMVMYPENYKSYLSVDFFNQQQRTAMINNMVDNILSIS